MNSIETLLKSIDVAQADYLAKVHVASVSDVRSASDKLKALKAELSAALASGANPCPTCGAAPHGMQQPHVSRGRTQMGVEIGCLGCPDHRAFGFTQAMAVAAWNAGPEAWIPPKAAQ
jgi:hypothetical protein